MKRWMIGLVWVAAGACSGGGADPTADVPSSADAASGFAVDERGGSFTADGVRFVVPAGALDRRVEIRVTSTDGPAPAGYALRSRLYRFEPEGLTFLAPLQVTLPFTAGGGADEFYWSRPQGGYERLASVPVGSTLTALVTHFSTGFVGSLLGDDAGLDASTDAPTIDVPTVDVPTIDVPTVDVLAVDVPLGVVAPARPLLPSTGARALSNRPLVRWALSAGVTGARLTFCRDRAQTASCVHADVTGDRGQPATALAAGTWFWSLQGIAGSVVGAARSAVWRLTVPTAAGAVQGQWGGEYDANGDGFAELVRPGTSLRVYAGGPGGIVTTPTTFDVAGSANVWATGDLDGDGYGDLAVAAGGSIYVFRGSATGPVVTSPAMLHGLEYSPQTLEFGDANGDGYADLLATCATCAAAGDLFLGSATGLSATPVPVLSGVSSNPALRFAGDLNGDGRDDMLVHATGCQALFGSATGAGTSPVDLGATATATCLALGDAQNDGYADLGVGDQIRAGGAAGVAATGVTDARLVLGRPWLNLQGPADFDGDGDDDLATVPGLVWVMSGEAPGERSVLAGWEDDAVEGMARLVGDLNGDGLPDWVDSSRIHYSVAGTPPGRRELLLAAPGNAFPTSIVDPGDMNGDGFDELLMTPAVGGASAYLYAGTATGYAPRPQLVAVPTTGTVGASAAGDLDRDGFADALVSAGASSVRVIYGGSGSVGARTATLSFSAITGSAIPVGVGDLNGDGYRDVLAFAGRTVSLFAGTATGPSATPQPLTVAGAGGSTVTDVVRGWGVGDLNADGRSDVALYVFSGLGGSFFRTLTTCLGTATGFTCQADNSPSIDLASDDRGMGPVGDVDADGRTEFAFGNSIYHYDGTRWASQRSFAPLTACPAGDQNGDGVGDTFVAGSTSIVVLPGVRGVGLSSTPLRTAHFGFASLDTAFSDSVGDRDGDGRREMAVSFQSAVRVSLSAPVAAWSALP